MGSKIKNLKTAKSQLTSLKKHLNNYAKGVEAAKNAINSMMKGNGTSAYWEGQNAITWYNQAIKTLNTCVDNYANSYNEFKDYASMVDKADAKANLKGLKKATLKTVLAKYNGAQYTNGVKKDIAIYKITGVASTVGANSVSDDYNMAAFNQYKALRTALTTLYNAETGVIDAWTAVVKNTTGTMNSDAKKRASTTQSKRKATAACKENLETDFIGDAIFSR